MVMPLPSRRHLLLVEDNPMVRETIILMLEDDYEVDLAISAATALDRMRASDSHAIDLMLLDCLLPDGNLAEVLNEADQRSIPVVLISGDPRQADAIDPSRRFLPKPFTQSILLTTLDTARG